MKISVFFTTLVFLVSTATHVAMAQDSSLDRLDDWSEAKGWEGVGLLMIGNSATCTGALIRPDLLLTAAHCLYGPSGRPVQPNTIDFRAAWRDGQAISRRVGKYALIHPNYRHGDWATSESIYYDVALMQLDMPVQGHVAQPFRLGDTPKQGAELAVVSYGSGRNDAASLQEQCFLKQDRRGIFAMSCSIVPGSSGSPVFTIRNGIPQVSSVISAVGHDGTAYGMDLSRHISQMLSDFDSGHGVYPAVVQPVRRVTANNTGSQNRTMNSGSGGALFLKP